MNQITELQTWRKLTKLVNQAGGLRPRSISPNHRCKAAGITLDYSRQHLEPDVLDCLFELAHLRRLPEKIQALMEGACVNTTENRPALHTALRMPADARFLKDRHADILPHILDCRAQIRDISESVRSGTWRGKSGKPITDVVHIGIGGSALGPRLALGALESRVDSKIRCHFLEDIDEGYANRLFSKLHPETTLFIVASKSFTTPETLHNARLALDFSGGKSAFAHHFVAITANIAHARTLGFETILPLWDWVGGRYSFCSAINLIMAIACGYSRFEAVLRGAHAMDQHFLESPLAENMPVLLGLAGIRNINVLNRTLLVMLSHGHALNELTPFIQQLDMESNGKSVCMDGNPVSHATGPVVWGGSASQARHSYFQLLCQGTHRIAGEFLSIAPAGNACALADEFRENVLSVLGGGVRDPEHAQGDIPGMPLSHILLKDDSPETLGALVALYEHKIFVQSVIWGINPFDQPGVDSAKRYMRQDFPLTAEI